MCGSILHVSEGQGLHYSKARAAVTPATSNTAVHMLYYRLYFRVVIMQKGEWNHKFGVLGHKTCNPDTPA